jgi:hypothetical protein
MPCPRARRVLRGGYGSVGTNSLGAFEIRHDQAGRDSAGARLPWNLVVTVAGPDGGRDGAHEVVLATVEREDASDTETARLVLSDKQLASAGLAPRTPLQDSDDLINREHLFGELRDKLRDARRIRFAAELNSTLDARAEAAKPFERFLLNSRASRPSAALVETTATWRRGPRAVL